MEVLRAENASKNFSGVWALRHVSFSLQAGQKLAVIGPNGAGKTTLINVLNGLLQLCEGKIYFLGRNITGLSTYKRAHMGIGRAFQNDTLFKDMPVWDNMLLACHGQKPSRFNLFRPFNSFPESNRQSEKLLRAIGLWDKRGEMVFNLSHGERKKLEIATSISSRPKLLLLDEPNAGLTFEESSEILEMIKQMDPQLAVIIVAHDMDLVFNLADEILVLHYGEVITQGKPDQVMCDARVKECYMGVKCDE